MEFAASCHSDVLPDLLKLRHGPSKYQIQGGLLVVWKVRVVWKAIPGSAALDVKGTMKRVLAQLQTTHRGRRQNAKLKSPLHHSNLR